MTILSLSPQLQTHIATKSEKISVFVQSEIDEFVQQDKHFSLIHRSAEKILTKNCFVAIKGIGFCRNKAVFEAFIKLFGRFFIGIFFV